MEYGTIHLTRVGFKKHKEVIEAWAEGHAIETWNGNVWIAVKYPRFIPTFKYRVKPKKPSINWDEVAEKFNYLTISSMGVPVLHQFPPKLDEKAGVWAPVNCDATYADAFKSFDRGNVHYTESLVCRPGFE